LTDVFLLTIMPFCKPDGGSEMHEVAVIYSESKGNSLIDRFRSMTCVRKVHGVLANTATSIPVSQSWSSVHCYDNYSDVLCNQAVSIVAIASEIQYRHEIAEQALTAGKHVLLMAPISEELDHAKRLIELSIRNERIIMINSPVLFSSAINKLKTLLCNGDFGKFIFYDSIRFVLENHYQEIDHSIDLAINDLMIINFLFGAMPIWVSCSCSMLSKDEHRFIAYMTLQYDNAALVHIRMANTSNVTIDKVILGFMKKTVVYDENNIMNKIKIYSYDNEWAHQIENSNIEDREKSNIMYPLLSPALKDNDALTQQCYYMIKCVDKKERPFNDGQTGLRILKILKAAQKSLESNGRKICLPKDV